MNRENFIRITFFISILVFNPAIADTLQISTNIEARVSTTITQDIASTLHKRGLEEMAARKKAEELTDGNDEAFASMLDNLLDGCRKISRDEMLDYLASAALHREQIALDSYDRLIHIYSKVKRSLPDKEIRNRLSTIARQNAMMIG